MKLSQDKQRPSGLVSKIYSSQYLCEDNLLSNKFLIILSFRYAWSFDIFKRIINDGLSMKQEMYPTKMWLSKYQAKGPFCSYNNVPFQTNQRDIMAMKGDFIASLLSDTYTYIHIHTETYIHTYLHIYIHNTCSTYQLKQQAVTNWAKLFYIESFTDCIRQKDMSIQVIIFYWVAALETRQNLQLQSSPDLASPLWATDFAAYTTSSLQITK